jgi:thiamine-phosphate pyrophosphorylase
MKPIASCYLYGIVDLGYVEPPDLVRVTKELIAGGIDLIQLRAKGASLYQVTRFASELTAVTRPEEIPLIINDFPEVLRQVDADGCHIGQEDGTIIEARSRAGRDCIVGRSTHSLEQAQQAAAEGADYIGFGPIFPTGTKPGAEAIGLDLITAVQAAVSIPVFCIGGIKLGNLDQLKQAGARRVCIVSDLLLADDIEEHTRAVKTTLTR